MPASSAGRSAGPGPSPRGTRRGPRGRRGPAAGQGTSQRHFTPGSPVRAGRRARGPIRCVAAVASSRRGRSAGAAKERAVTGQHRPSRYRPVRRAWVLVIAAIGLMTSACGASAAASTPAASTPAGPSAPAASSGGSAQAGPATQSHTASADAAAKPLAGKVVGIDPGHNGRNRDDPSYLNHLIWNGREWETCDTTGTETDSGYTEARYNFNVARYLRADSIRRSDER